MSTKNITNETANENFITDHGSTRFTKRRARRGPRPAAVETVLRADRTASATRPALPPATVAVPTVARPAGRCGRVGVPAGFVWVDEDGAEPGLWGPADAVMANGADVM